MTGFFIIRFDLDLEFLIVRLGLGQTKSSTKITYPPPTTHHTNFAGTSRVLHFYMRIFVSHQGIDFFTKMEDDNPELRQAIDDEMKEHRKVKSADIWTRAFAMNIYRQN
jgi:hypothetical protein